MQLFVDVTATSVAETTSLHLPPPASQEASHYVRHASNVLRDGKAVDIIPCALADIQNMSRQYSLEEARQGTAQDGVVSTISIYIYIYRPNEATRH
jgi:hypothetical protein